MKRFFILFLTLTLVLSFSSCNTRKNNISDYIGYPLDTSVEHNFSSFYIGHYRTHSDAILYAGIFDVNDSKEIMTFFYDPNSGEISRIGECAAQNVELVGISDWQRFGRFIIIFNVSGDLYISDLGGQYGLLNSMLMDYSTMQKIEDYDLVSQDLLNVDDLYDSVKSNNLENWSEYSNCYKGEDTVIDYDITKSGKVYAVTLNTDNMIDIVHINID